MPGPNGHASLETPLLVVERGRQIALPPIARLLLTEAQHAERAKLLAGRFFMVNMSLGDVGEIFRCGRCGAKHARLTKYCLDRPFSGLHGALYGFVTTLQGADARLSPAAATRVNQIKRLFSATDGLPDLASSHPELAHTLSGPSDGGVTLDVGVVSLGLLERIETRDAQQQLDRINVRAFAYGYLPLVVPGLRSPS